MGKEHYPYLTPALVTVAACTFGAYLIWRKGVTSAVQPTNTNEIVVMTRNRGAETVEDDRTATADGKKSVQDQDLNYLEISARCETTYAEFYDSEKTHFSLCDDLHCFSEAPEEGKNEDRKCEPNKKNEELKTSNENSGFSRDVLHFTVGDSLLSSRSKIEAPAFESNATINNKTLEHISLEEYISRQRVTSPDPSQDISSINKVPDTQSNRTINNNSVTLLDLRQISGTKNVVSLQDLPQTSDSKNELNNIESNDIVINNTVTLLDLRQISEPKNNVTLKDLPRTSESKNDLNNIESNDNVINNTVTLLDLRQISKAKIDVTLQDLPQTSESKNELNSIESNDNVINNTVTLLDLRQISKPKIDVTLQDLPQTSDSKNDLNSIESNDNVINNTVTLLDLRQISKPKIDVTLQDLPQTSDSKNDLNNIESNDNAINKTVSQSGHIQTIQGFFLESTKIVEEDSNKMSFKRKRKSKNPMYLALKEGNSSVVLSLLRQGASMDFTDRQGQCPTHLAAASGNIDLLEMLVSWGGDLSRKDMFGYTPFHRAALSGQTETIKWLYERGGAFLKETSWSGWTALHLAVMNGHYHASVQLLKFGANVNAKDRDGWTPLYLANVYKRTEVMKLLQSWGGTI